YLLDVLLFSDIGERAALIASYGKEVRNLERRMADLATRTAAGRDGHHRSRTPAPER
ncbi:DNA primase, partial [Drancourtella sp. An210]